MQSHFDQNLKYNNQTSFVSFETIPSSKHLGHSKVNLNGNQYNLSNNLQLVSLNNEQQIVNSDTIQVFAITRERRNQFHHENLKITVSFYSPIN